MLASAVRTKTDKQLGTPMFPASLMARDTVIVVRCGALRHHGVVAPWMTMRMLLYHQGTCCPSTHKLLSAPRDETCHRSRVRMPPTLYLHIALTRNRKHWRQLDDFHSLTDLKIHVSSHKEPQITAGLRSVCWKVCTLARPHPA